MDYTGNDRIFVTSTVKYTLDGKTRGKINIIQGRLNRSKAIHRGDIDLPPLDSEESDRWFLGGKYNSSVTYDFGYTADDFIFNTWVKDGNLTVFTPENSDASVLLLSRGNEIYKLAVNAAGKWILYRQEHRAWHRLQTGDAADLSVDGTVNDDSDTDTGFAAQVRIPWKELGGAPHKGEFLHAHPAHWDKLKSAEKAARRWEELDGESSDYPTEWLTLRLI